MVLGWNIGKLFCWTSFLEYFHSRISTLVYARANTYLAVKKLSALGIELHIFNSLLLVLWTITLGNVLLTDDSDLSNTRRLTV